MSIIFRIDLLEAIHFFQGIGIALYVCTVPLFKCPSKKLKIYRKIIFGYATLFFSF